MELLIVTGLSGAGKSQTLRKLEDLGFFCVDNLPCEMLAGFVKLCERTEPEVERAAVVIDSRESIFKTDLDDAIDGIERLGVRYRIIYLDCRNDTLIKRYNETRRVHPMADNVEDGINAERELLSGVRDRADWIIDTSNMKPLELSEALDGIASYDTAHDFMITIESFGYKRGVPFEADMVFDMRFTPNPFYEQQLRHLSGKDAPVRDFIRKDGSFDDFINAVEAMLDKLIPLYKQQGKHRLLVAFGCTGGRHRSVCAAEEISMRLKKRYHIATVHRDMRSEAEAIIERTGRS